MTALSTPLAFLRKDFLAEMSYRLRLFLELASAALGIYFLVILSDFIGEEVAHKIGGVSYLAFALVGISFHSLHETALNDFSRKIREAQTLGTLEALLATRTSILTVMACLPLYSMLRTALKLLVYLFVGGLLFSNVEMHWGNWPAMIGLFAISMVVFICLGLSFAALTIVFKRTEPIIQGFNMLSFFLGGVFIPIASLPEWVRPLAHAMPVQPALTGFRAAVLQDASWSELWPSIGHLLIFAALIVPISILAVRWAVRRALLDGSLTQY